MNLSILKILTEELECKEYEETNDDVGPLAREKRIKLRREHLKQNIGV